MFKAYSNAWRYPVPAVRWLAGFIAFMRALPARYARATQRYRQRRQLTELDDHHLRDIGLTRRDVRRECAKPFWDA